jgi:tetratricopeptide (TPR) repeat protein
LDELAAAGFVERRGDDVRLVPGLARLCRLHLHHDEPARRRARTYTRLLRHLARESARQAERLFPASPNAPTDRAAAHAADEWFTRHWRLLHHLAAAPAIRDARELGRWRRIPRVRGARWSGDAVEVARPPTRRARRAWSELARSLQAWYEHRGRDHRTWALARSVRAVAAAAGLDDAEAWAGQCLGTIALRRGQWARAATELDRAAGRADPRDRASALTNRGVARLHLGRVDEAVADLRTARRLRSRHDRVGRGITDLDLGEALHRAGRPDEARRHLVAAADALDGVEPRGLAAALANLVLVEAALGRPADALRAAAAARDAYARLGDTAGGAEVRLNTAVALLAAVPPRAAEADALLTRLVTERGEDDPTPLLARAFLHAGDAARLRDRPATARLLWARAADVATHAPDPTTREAALTRLTG